MIPQSSTLGYPPARGLQLDKLPRLLLIIGFLGVALLLALMIAIGQFVPALALFGLVTVPIFVFLVMNLVGMQHDGIFWVLLLTVLLSSLASALTHRPFSFLSTGVLFVAAPFVFFSVVRLTKWDVSAIVVALLVGAFFAFGAISGFTGRSKFLPAIYTGLMALKPYLLVGFGASVVWSARTQRGFYGLVRWAWLPFLLVSLIQWFAPSIYLAVLADVESIPENNPFAPGFPRATGTFQQPSILAAFACMFGLIVVIDAMLKRRARDGWPCLFYLLLVIMTGQRQELLAALVSAPLAYVMIRWRPSLPTLAAVATGALSVTVGLLAIAVPDIISQELRNWGVVGGGSESARAILYGDAVGLANRYWPLGTGFGTFGSVGSVKMDQSLYQEMGYGSFWWFGSQSYLMDAYWAKYIAETGWIGFFLQVAFYAVVFRCLAGWVREDEVRRDAAAFRVSMFAFVGLCFVLLTSPTAFTLSEPHGGLVPLLFIGVAWQHVARIRSMRSPSAL